MAKSRLSLKVHWQHAPTCSLEGMWLTARNLEKPIDLDQDKPGWGTRVTQFFNPEMMMCISERCTSELAMPWPSRPIKQKSVTWTRAALSIEVKPSRPKASEVMHGGA